MPKFVWHAAECAPERAEECAAKCAAGCEAKCAAGCAAEYAAEYAGKHQYSYGGISSISMPTELGKKANASLGKGLEICAD